MSTLLLQDKAETSSGALAVCAAQPCLHWVPRRALTLPPPVSSTPVSTAAPSGSLDTLYKRLEELDERVQQLEVISGDTEKNVVGICDRLDELSSAIAAQEKTFNQRLADVLAQINAQSAESNSLVAELCTKVQSQEEQLQKLMEARETSVVEVQSAATVPAGTLTRLGRAAAKAAGLG